jgi:hypothetical protein
MANNSKVKTRIQSKHDLEVNWSHATFVPMAGEIIVYDSEVDENGDVKTNSRGDALLPEGRTAAYNFARFKVGDGIHSPNDLPFTGNGIGYGTEDPDADIPYQFYFKYSN